MSFHFVGSVTKGDETSNAAGTFLGSRVWGIV